MTMNAIGRSGLSSLMGKVQNAALAMQRKDWEQGVLAQAFWESGEVEAMICMARAALIYPLEDGRLAAIAEGALVDSAMLGEALLQAARLTGDPSLKAAEERLRDYLLNRAPRASDGVLFHNPHQVWVDSFYCAAPYFAVCGEYDQALDQIEKMRLRLWSADQKMYSHIWDEAAQSYANEAFWGVGNGWAAAGLTRVIRALPPERDTHQRRLVGYLTELLERCLAHQRPDGLFHNCLDRADTFVETNAGQMFAFAIYAGIGGGWLSPKHRSAADRMRAAAHAKVDSHGFVQDVCGAPYFDRPGVAPEGQAFFLMMEAAAHQLNRGAET